MYFYGIIEFHSGMSRGLYVYYPSYPYGREQMLNKQLVSGLANMMVSLFLLIGSRFFLRFTVQNGNWWTRLSGVMNGDCSSKYMRDRMKRSSADLYTTVYGFLAAMGIFTLGIGILFMNSASEMLYAAVGVIDVLLGIFITFGGYKLYMLEIEKLAREAYPAIDA